MRYFCRLGVLSLGVLMSAALVGCNSAKTDSAAATAGAPNVSDSANADITAALAELSPEDRVAAQAQKYCAVEQENLLGTMGAPFKVMVNDKPVFLCCEGCKEKALKDPEATLAAVAKLTKANSTAK